MQAYLLAASSLVKNTNEGGELSEFISFVGEPTRYSPRATPTKVK